MFFMSVFFQSTLVREHAQDVNSCQKNATFLPIIALLISIVPLVSCTKKIGEVSLSATESATQSQPDAKARLSDKIKYYENVLREAFETLPEAQGQEKNGFVYSIINKTDGVLWYLSIVESKPSVNTHNKSNGRSPFGATIYFEKPGVDHPPSIAVHWKDPEREDINFYPDRERLLKTGGAQAREIAELIQKIGDVSNLQAITRIASAVKNLSTILVLQRNEAGRVVAPKAVLRGANLADFDLQNAKLRSSDLRDADLRGANLQSAELIEANLLKANLRDTDLRGAAAWNANLTGADLRGANLQEANLWHADLQEADLRGADLEKATLGEANFRGANLQGANFKQAYLKKAIFQEANLQGANLWGADLEFANLQGANLQGANLQGANLQGANLRRVNLQGANLQGANLQGANLQGANLQGANLQGANLQEAKLQRANLYQAKLKNANLRGASLNEAKMPFLWQCIVYR